MFIQYGAGSTAVFVLGKIIADVWIFLMFIRFNGILVTLFNARFINV